MRVLSILVLCLSLAWSQVSPLCGNSPKSAAELKTILQKALTNLNLEYPFYQPNLVEKQVPLGPKPCDPVNAPQNCGYPLLYLLGDPSKIIGFPNPNSQYGAAFTNASFISDLAKNNGTPSSTPSSTDFLFSVDPSEAIIWLGCTSPGGVYWSFTRNIYSFGDPNVLANYRLGVLGDAVNNVNANVWAKNTSSKFGAATLLIYTADVYTANRIQDAFASAGFPKQYHNVQSWPTAMVPLGTNPKTDANLFIIGRLYGLPLPLFTAYNQLVVQNQPFVRLTPKLPVLSSTPINPIFSWTPDYTNLSAVLTQSEQGYSPFLDQFIQATTSSILTALQTKTQKAFNGLPSRPFRDEDDGSKWIFQHFSQGFLGDRDTNYYIFTPELGVDYSLGLFTVAFGVRHESTAWHTKLPNPAVPILPTPAPGNHALYWNFAFNDPHTEAAIGYFDYNDAAGFVAPAAYDPLGVIWAHGFGTPAGCALLHAVAPNINCSNPGSTYVSGSLLIVERTYVNPLTGVYPSPATILTPTVVHFAPKPTS